MAAPLWGRFFCHELLASGTSVACFCSFEEEKSMSVLLSDLVLETAGRHVPSRAL